MAYKLLMEGNDILILLLELTSLISSCCSSFLLSKGIRGLLLSQPGQQLLCLLQRSCMLNHLRTRSARYHLNSLCAVVKPCVCPVLGV